MLPGFKSDFIVLFLIKLNIILPKFRTTGIILKLHKFTSIMKRSRRVFSGAFKAQVAMEAIKERETMAELSKRFEVHPQMISKWKQEFIERSHEIFDTTAPEENLEKEKDRLYAKIGQLEMERDWLKKISRKAGL